jgi:hypothetical protein
MRHVMLEVTQRYWFVNTRPTTPIPLRCVEDAALCSPPKYNVDQVLTSEQVKITISQFFS